MGPRLVLDRQPRGDVAAAATVDCRDGAGGRRARAARSAGDRGHRPARRPRRVPAAPANSTAGVAALVAPRAGAARAPGDAAPRLAAHRRSAVLGVGVAALLGGEPRRGDDPARAPPGDRPSLWRDAGPDAAGARRLRRAPAAAGV